MNFDLRVSQSVCQWNTHTVHVQSYSLQIFTKPAIKARSQQIWSAVTACRGGGQVGAYAAGASRGDAERECGNFYAT